MLSVYAIPVQYQSGYRKSKNAQKGKISVSVKPKVYSNVQIAREKIKNKNLLFIVVGLLHKFTPLAKKWPVTKI